MTLADDLAAAAARTPLPGANEDRGHVPAKVRPQIARYVGRARAIEKELHRALLLVSSRHGPDVEVANGAATLASWSLDHLTWLERLAADYGAKADDRPATVRAALLNDPPPGAAGALADLSDLAVLVEQAWMTWTILIQGGRENHDHLLVAVASEAREHNRRQAAWLRTMVEHEAPDALAVAPPKRPEIPLNAPRIDALPAIPDKLWGPIVAGGLLVAVGALGLLFRQPWLLPSLGPSAVLLAMTPAHPTARPWNVIVGHLGGIVAGFAAIVICGAATAPSVLTDGQLVPSRVLAGGLAVAVTIVLGQLLRAAHPPAAATALLVSLGSIATLEKTTWLVAGVIAIAILGEAARWARLEHRAPIELRAPKGSMAARRLHRQTRTG